VRYAPYYQFAPFLGVGVNTGLLTPGYGYAAASQRSLGTNASMELTNQYAKRSSISAGVAYSGWQFFDGSPGGVSGLTGHASYQYNLTRGLSLHLGYRRDFNRYSDTGGSTAANDTIDAGLSYGDSFQIGIGRRASLSFTTSNSIVHFGGDTHFRLNGSVEFSRGFTRTWGTSAGYVRSTEFQPGFIQPIFQDSTMASVHGLLAPRLQSSTAIGYSRGEIGFGGSAYTTYSVGSRLTFALRRRLGLYGQYGYYYYRVPPGSSVLPLWPIFSRHAVSAGLTVWTPLIGQERISS
jgi:hypothetical protein